MTRLSFEVFRRSLFFFCQFFVLFSNDCPVLVLFWFGLSGGDDDAGKVLWICNVPQYWGTIIITIRVSVQTHWLCFKEWAVVSPGEKKKKTFFLFTLSSYFHLLFWPRSGCLHVTSLELKTPQFLRSNLIRWNSKNLHLLAHDNLAFGFEEEGRSQCIYTNTVCIWRQELIFEWKQGKKTHFQRFVLSRLFPL